MNDRSKLISRLLNEKDYRAAYIRAKLDVLVPSQLRALRLRQNKTQPVLAEMAGMKQSRISAMETPGRVNFNLDTLVRMAASLNVGMQVKFVPFSEMLNWENEYSQESFNATQLGNDIDFLRPAAATIRKRPKLKQSSRRIRSSAEIFRTLAATGGVGASTYTLPAQGERAQLRLQFDTPKAPPTQDRLADVISLPNRSGSVVNDLSTLRTAAAAGAGRHYGI
jgi:transcriptional regulator with XRE-family HTH domain